MKLDRLKKTFADGTEAVRELSLEATDGEFIVLLGPSGCGKTTTLRMIAGLETPTSGSIHIGNRDVTALPPSRRDVGFVFQFYALYPHMTVRRNILFPLENVGLSPSERRRVLQDVVDRLGLSALLDRHPGELSGGDQQRVSLARAMVRKPSIYLMDEPLGTLDADRRLELREAIRAQQLDLGVTTVYVTHDQEEALSLADRIVVMEGGRIRQVGPPSEVYDTPSNLFVADFVGSPGMNLLEGVVSTSESRTRFTAGDVVVFLSGPVRPGRAILGVRPEFVRPSNDSPLAGEVDIIEYLGDHRICHVRTAVGTLRLRTAADTVLQSGDRLRLAFDPEHIRLFDPDTGARL